MFNSIWMKTKGQKWMLHIIICNKCKVELIYGGMWIHFDVWKVMIYNLRFKFLLMNISNADECIISFFFTNIGILGED